MLLVNNTKRGNTEEDNMNPPVLDDLFIIQNFIHKLPHGSAVFKTKDRDSRSHENGKSV